MISESLPIYIDLYNLIEKLLSIAENFDRFFKFTIGQKMIIDTLDLLTIVQLTNTTTDPQERESLLEKFLAKFGVVKTMIQLCLNNKRISYEQSAELILIVDKIGKQATAWKNRGN